MNELYGMRNGLNVDNLDETSDDEIDTFLNRVRRGRGPLDPGPQYEMRADAMWLHTRPDFAKLHMRVLDAWHSQGVDPIISASSFANLHTYINQAFLPGIENCTRGLQRRGVSKAQLLEGIMQAQLSGGMRGLECCFQALGEWYERTIGWVPPGISFLAKHDPRSLKATRARWEGCFRGALPKQMMPYFMLRHNTVIGNKGGLREAVALAKAWGVTHNYIVNTIIQGAYYFTGMERMDLVDEAVGDLL
jgi:hypothetical protein